MSGLLKIALFLFLCLPFFAQTRDPRKVPVAPAGLGDLKVNPPEIYPSGGNVAPPRLKFSPDPVYPRNVQEMTGIVVLQLVVDEQGNTEQIKVTKGLNPDLDKAAIDAVKRWKFFPTRVDGKLVKVKTPAVVKLQPPA